MAEAGVILGLLETKGSQVEFTGLGRQLRKADSSGERQLLAKQLRERIPLVQTVERLLTRNRRSGVSGAIILDLMDEHLTTPQVDQTFRTLVSWLRFTGIAHYSDDTQRFQRPADTSKQT